MLNKGLLPSPMGRAKESRTFGAYLGAIATKEHSLSTNYLTHRNLDE
jgi:hypothetical protein